MKGVPVMWIPLRGMMNEPQHPEALEFQLWSGEQRERRGSRDETTTAVISRRMESDRPSTTCPSRTFTTNPTAFLVALLLYIPLEKGGGDFCDKL